MTQFHFEPMKTCKKCGLDLPLDAFYGHPRMADGHLNFCVECVCKRVAEHRAAHIEQIQAYDKRRAQDPVRRAKAAAVSRRCRDRGGYGAAHCAVQHAKERGELVPPSECPSCGKETRVIAHHDNYSEPLIVIWLRQACHVQLHRSMAAVS